MRLWLGLVLAAGGCGLDVVGTGSSNTDPQNATTARDGGASSPMEGGGGTSGTSSGGTPPIDAASPPPPPLPPPATGSLDLKATVRAPAQATIDLTPLGPVDWAYWPGPAPVRHESGGGLIGNWTVTQGAPIFYGKNDYSPTYFTWTNGNLAAPSGGNNNYLIYEKSEPFTVNLQADASSLRTLSLWGACFEADCDLTVSLTDASATPKSDARTIAFGAVPLLYEVTYQAKDPTAKLLVSWTLKKLNQSDGALVIGAAALR